MAYTRVEIIKLDAGGGAFVSATAYLVGVLDTTTGQFLGCSFFSEPSPTMEGRRWPFVMLKKDGHTYDAAEFALRCAISETPGLVWVKRFLLERGDSPLPDTVGLLRQGVAEVCDHFEETPVPRNLLQWVDRAQEAVRRLRGEG